MTDIDEHAKTGFAASTCQLSYSLQSVPSVLQASVAGAESSVADIMLTIFNNTQAQVTIDSIVVTLPVGDDASSLVVDVSSITPNAAPSSQWTLNSPSLANVDTTAAYTLLPQSGASAPLAAGAAIVVTLSGVQINHFTGTASIAIDETTSAGEGSTALPVTKYPPGFFFDSLLVNVPNGSELQPVAQVARTTQVTLSWNVSALDPSAIAIFYSSNQGQQGPINPPQVNQSSPIAIYSDTVFTVIVTTTAAGGEPVVRALSTSVSVQQPDAVLNQVQAQTLSVGQATTLSGPLSAQGGVAVTNGLTTDSVQASGPATLGATDINGLLTVNGGMRALHQSWFWQSTLQSGSWQVTAQRTMQNDVFWLASAPGAASIQFTWGGTTLGTASDWFLQPVPAGADFFAVIEGSNATTVSLLFVSLGAAPGIDGPEMGAKISITTSSGETGL